MSTPSDNIENNYTDYTTLINGEAAESAILERKVRYIPFNGYIGSVMEGFVLRSAPVGHRDYPHHFIIVDDNGSVRIQNKVEMSISRIYNPSVTANNALVSVSRLTWEKLNLERYNTDLQKEIGNKQQELDKWEERVAKACEEADERGYCSEFEAIAEAAGFDIPAEEEFEFQVRATILVTVYQSARTEAKAKEKVRDNLHSLVYDKISGEDEIEDTDLVD